MRLYIFGSGDKIDHRVFGQQHLHVRSGLALQPLQLRVASLPVLRLKVVFAGVMPSTGTPEWRDAQCSIQ
jgi:hypothetical protein